MPPAVPLLLLPPALLLLAAARPAAPPHRPTFTCGGVVSGESGFIGSEGFPGVYPPNSKCTWKITVPEGKVVVLSFRYLDLESDNLCRYDFVDIYNGHANGQRIGRFCGTVKPGALVSSSNKMLVQMTSDANTAGSGFIAKFSAAEPHERGDQYCGGRLEKPSGSFHTPNWPERDYPAGVTCSWHIVAPKNQVRRCHRPAGTAQLPVPAGTSTSEQPAARAALGYCSATWLIPGWAGAASTDTATLRPSHLPLLSRPRGSCASSAGPRSSISPK